MFYVSLALSDTMLPDRPTLNPQRVRLSPVRAKALLREWGGEVVSALNPSHSATIAAVKERCGVSLPVGKDAPQIVLAEGDYLLVCQAKFPRRLKEGERYSDLEIACAPISFSLWSL